MSDETDDIKVFITAASPVLRAGLEAVLQRDEKLTVAGAAAQMPPARFGYSNRQPIDVFLINVEGEKDFDDLLEFLGDAPAEGGNSPAVVALFPPELQTAETFLRALRGDVRAVLPHDASASEITSAVLAAASGLISLTPEMMDSLLSFSKTALATDSLIENGSQTFSGEMIEALTRRELEVLEMLAEGASNKTIADRLNISEHTVKFHLASVFGKLGAGSRTEAVTLALRRGLVLL